MALDSHWLSKTLNAEEVVAFKEAEEKNLRMTAHRIRVHEKPVFMVKPAPQPSAEPEASALPHTEGIPVYPNLRRAARVLHHLVWYKRYLDAI